MNQKPEERISLDLSEIGNKWLHLSGRQREAMLNIVRDIHSVGPVACTVLEMQVKRLAEGAERYKSDFAEEERDWLLEALNEGLDMTSYLSAAIVGMMHRRDGKKT